MYLGIVVGSGRGDSDCWGCVGSRIDFLGLGVGVGALFTKIDCGGF